MYLMLSLTPSMIDEQALKLIAHHNIFNSSGSVPEVSNF